MSKKVLRTIFSLIIFGLFFYFLFQEWPNIKTLRITNYSYLLMLIPGYFLFICINGLLYKYALLPFGYKTSVELGLITSFVGSIGNIFLPLKGGLVGSGILYQRWAGVPLVVFAVATAALQIAVFWLTSLLGWVLLILLGDTFPETDGIIHLAFLGLSLGIPLFFIVNKISNKYWEKYLPKVVNNGLSGLQKMISSQEFFFVIGLTFLNLLVLAFNIYASLRAIGTEVDFMKTLASGVFSSFSVLLSLTPSGLGIREAFLFFSSKAFDIPTLPLVMTGVLDRVMTILVSVLFLLFSQRRIKYLINKTN